MLGWKNNSIVFIEAKQRGRDAMRISQRAWLEAALKKGFSTGNFFVLEWSLSPAPKRREKKVASKKAGRK